MTIPSASAFTAFSAPLQDEAAVRALAAQGGMSDEKARAYLSFIVNEGYTAIRLLEWAGAKGHERMLEVGAGGGLITSFLQSRGADLVAIEPVGDGFDATQALQQVVADAVGFTPTILPVAACDLDPEQHGTFDLIFSVNVVEHFQPMRENLDGLARVMRKGAISVHTCPNYDVPYEPHYGIPLIPLAQHLTPFLFRPQMRSEGVWKSLNFITSRDVRSYARRHGLLPTFKSGTMADAVARLEEEPDFASRHPPLLGAIAAVLKRTRARSLLARLPPALSTPMTFKLAKAARPT